MRVKVLVLLASSVVAASSLGAQQPVAPSPRPASAAAAQDKAAEQRVLDSMRTADARSQVPVVALNDAVDLALKSYPTVALAQAQLDIAHAQQRQAIGSWLPSLSINSSVNRRFTSTQVLSTGTLQQTPNPFSYSAGIAANVTLFDFGRRLYQNRQQNANATAQEASLVNQKFQVTLLTKQAFFNALAAADLERVALAAVQRSQEQLKIAREKLSAGSAIRSDTLSAMVTLGQARLQLLNAQSQRATQEATLARLIGFDRPVRPVGDSTLFLVTSLDTAAIRTEALSGSPVVSQADAQLRLSDAVVKANRTVYLPVVSASYTNNRAGNGGTWTGGFDFGALTPTSSFALALSWPLFNGFVRETNLVTAEANRDAAAASAADSRRNVNAQVTQYLAAMDAAGTQLSIAGASREAADEALRIQRERYRLGAATIVDVLNAQVALNQAESDAVNARVNYQVNKAQLETLVGHSL